MHDAIEEMKVRADLLHKKFKRGDSRARQRLASTGEPIQRRHCLDAVARQFGFDDFRHARRVIDADGPSEDFGRLLYRARNHGSLNHWYASYDEARSHQRASGGYLLPYRKQFMVVSAAFVRDLGLDPQAEAWTRMNFDWVRPADPDARRQLYANLVGQAPQES